MPQLVNIRHSQSRNNIVARLAVNTDVRGVRTLYISNSLQHGAIAIELDEPTCQFLREAAGDA